MFQQLINPSSIITIPIATKALERTANGRYYHCTGESVNPTLYENIRLLGNNLRKGDKSVIHQYENACREYEKEADSHREYKVTLELINNIIVHTRVPTKPTYRDIYQNITQAWTQAATRTL